MRAEGGAGREQPVHGGGRGMRVVYNGVDDLAKLIPDLSDEEKAGADFGIYSADQFFDDLGRITQFRINPDLAEILVRRSFDTMMWMRTKGVRFVPMYGRQAFKVEGKFKFWGGLTVESWGGGPGLVDALFAGAERNGIEAWYEARACELL